MSTMYTLTLTPLVALCPLIRFPELLRTLLRKLNEKRYILKLSGFQINQLYLISNKTSYFSRVNSKTNSSLTQILKARRLIISVLQTSGYDIQSLNMTGCFKNLFLGRSMSCEVFFSFIAAKSRTVALHLARAYKNNRCIINYSIMYKRY